jgi:hypothetical protein
MRTPAVVIGTGFPDASAVAAHWDERRARQRRISDTHHLLPRLVVATKSGRPTALSTPRRADSASCGDHFEARAIASLGPRDGALDHEDRSTGAGV